MIIITYGGKAIARCNNVKDSIPLCKSYIELMAKKQLPIKTIKIIQSYRNPITGENVNKEFIIKESILLTIPQEKTQDINTGNT